MKNPNTTTRRNPNNNNPSDKSPATKMTTMVADKKSPHTTNNNKANLPKLSPSPNMATTPLLVMVLITSPKSLERRDKTMPKTLDLLPSEPSKNMVRTKPEAMPRIRSPNPSDMLMILPRSTASISKETEVLVTIS